MNAAISRINKHKINLKSIIDIGASNGQWSKIAMSYFKDASILAVEPLSERLKKLSEISKKNHCCPVNPEVINSLFVKS
jgi:FkbM family methyltransferase